MASGFGVLDLPIEKLDFQGDRVREGFKGRVTDRNGIGPLVSPQLSRQSDRSGGRKDARGGHGIGCGFRLGRGSKKTGQVRPDPVAGFAMISALLIAQS